MLSSMDVSAIVKAIDDRIALLRQVSSLLSATAVPATEKRAKAAVAAIEPAKAAKPTSGRKPMSAEGRARIVAAQKKRWALKNGASATQEDGKATKTAAAKGATGKKAGAVAAPSKAGKASKTVKTDQASKATKASTPAKKTVAKTAAVKKAAPKPAAVKKAAVKKTAAKKATVKPPVEETTAVGEAAPVAEDTQS